VEDFLDLTGKAFSMRRGRSGPWIERETDPEAHANNERLLRESSANLGVLVNANDYIVDVARRLRALRVA
jgi:hypothetical protein